MQAPPPQSALSTQWPPPFGSGWQKPPRHASPVPHSRLVAQARSQAPLRHLAPKPHSLLNWQAGVVGGRGWQTPEVQHSVTLQSVFTRHAGAPPVPVVPAWPVVPPRPVLPAWPGRHPVRCCRPGRWCRRFPWCRLLRSCRRGHPRRFRRRRSPKCLPCRRTPRSQRRCRRCCRRRCRRCSRRRCRPCRDVGAALATAPRAARAAAARSAGAADACASAFTGIRTASVVAVRVGHVSALRIVGMSVAVLVGSDHAASDGRQADERATGGEERRRERGGAVQFHLVRFLSRPSRSRKSRAIRRSVIGATRALVDAHESAISPLGDR